jgi:hypothetical protein
MTQSCGGKLVEFNSEIERTFRWLCWESKQRALRICYQGDNSSQVVEIMEVNQGENGNGQYDHNGNGGNRVENNGNSRRTMGDYAKQSLSAIESCITRPRVEANNFEIEPNFI